MSYTFLYISKNVKKINVIKKATIEGKPFCEGKLHYVCYKIHLFERSYKTSFMKININLKKVTISPCQIAALSPNQYFSGTLINNHNQNTLINN